MIIEHDDTYYMAWDFVKERYEVDPNTCKDCYLLDELENLAVQCELVFEAIGSCEDEKTFQSVMHSLCRAWENGRAYEEGKKEDELEIFRDALDTVLYKWEQGELKELKEIKL